MLSRSRSTPSRSSSSSPVRTPCVEKSRQVNATRPLFLVLEDEPTPTRCGVTSRRHPRRRRDVRGDRRRDEHRRQACVPCAARIPSRVTICVRRQRKTHRAYVSWVCAHMGACASRGLASRVVDDGGDGGGGDVVRDDYALDAREGKVATRRRDGRRRGERRAFEDPRDSAEDVNIDDDDDDDDGDHDGRDAIKFDPLHITGFVDRRASVNDDGSYEDKDADRVVSRASSKKLVEDALNENLRSSDEIIRTMASRLCAKDWESNTETFQHLMNLPDEMPKREGDGGPAWLSREPPELPVLLSRRFGEAIRHQQFDWATKEDVVNMFHPDVEFMNVHGEYFEGRADVLKSLNESVQRMSTRMRLSSARGDGSTLKFMKFTTEGPTYDGRGRRPNWSVWTMDYSFKLLLLTVRIREYISIDDDTELIMKLARKRIK